MAESQKEFFSEIKNEFKDLGSKVNKLFDELVRGGEHATEIVVAGDVYEIEGMVVFALDLPGFEKKDVNVQIRDNQLLVRGTRTREFDETVTFLQRERSFGSFERAFTLPAGLDTNQVRAKFDKGVLRISLPKETVEIESTEIEID